MHLTNNGDMTDGRGIWRAFFQATTLLLSALLCACTPYQQLIHQQGLSDNVVQSAPYKHRILINQAGQQSTPPTHWHVYIEGDGRAVTRSGKPNWNPTPAKPMLLSMMAEDPKPALYLGRPCYFYTDDPACSALQWTLARYSEVVVTSLCNALLSQINPQDTVTLIGHSGGATLAALMAPRLPNVRQLVTLAGNLQVQTWTQHHGFSPLTLSLDPMALAPIPANISQYHLAGAQDQQILWQWIEAFSKNQPNAHVQLLPQADHQRGWPPWWTLIKLRSTIKAPHCDKVTRYPPAPEGILECMTK